ncbi:hypothetical protein OH686_23795 [Pseudomonas sp. SO81]|nr:hypothetical protein OH686_23795 [Pseudomonas sp. SO81]
MNATIVTSEAASRIFWLNFRLEGIARYPCKVSVAGYRHGLCPMAAVVPWLLPPLPALHASQTGPSQDCGHRE